MVWPTISGKTVNARLQGLLTDFYVRVIDVANLTHRCHSFFADHAHFTTWQPDLRVFILAPDQLCRGACRTDHLPTVTRFQLDVMNPRADWDIPQWQRIAVA